MQRLIRYFYCLAAGLFFLHPAMAIGAEPRLFLPTAERMYGEALFGSAYQCAVDGKVSLAIEKLDEALRYDPYLVSYYLLRAYCLSLLGNYGEALEDLQLYLEVRAEDPFATGLLREVEDKTAFLRDSLSSGISGRAVFSGSGTFRKHFGLDPVLGPSFVLPGRPAMNGNVLTLCDPEKGKIWVYTRENEKWDLHSTIPVDKKIVRVIPSGGQELILAYGDGSFQKGLFTDKGFVTLFNGNAHAPFLSDAVFHGAGLMAVADRINGKINIVDTSDGTVVYSWKPASHPFEPVALSSLGTLLAVADRAEKRVNVIDIISRKDLLEMKIPGHPRSVEWISSSNLLVLTEERNLFEVSLKEGKCSSLGRSFPESWFLFGNGRGGVYVTDTRLFRYSEFHIHTSKGFISLKYPKPLSPEFSKNHNWIVEARLIQPLGAYCGEDRIFQGILGGSLTDVAETTDLPAGPPLEPKTLPDPSYEELTQGKIKHLMLNPQILPDQIDELIAFGGYVLSNGTAVHLLGDSRLPSLEQLRLSEATGGRYILSRQQVKELRPCTTSSLRIALKPSVELPGDPRSSGLFITGRAGGMNMEGRIPFWNAFLPFPR